MANPVTLFPAPPATKFNPSDKLKKALKDATARHSTSTTGPWHIAISFVDLGAADLTADTAAPSSLPIGGFRDDKEDYNASVAKIGVMYSAYCLRDMARRFALVNPPAAKTTDALAQATLFKQLRDTLSGKIEASSARATGGSSKFTRFPAYEQVLRVKKAGGGLDIDFTTSYSHSLDEMIIPSDNGHAMKCVHGLGFAYLNGAFADAGFFADPLGFWVGGDFQLGKVWPPIRIPTDNDGKSSVASTSDACVRLLAMMVLGGVLTNDKNARDGMRKRLVKAAEGVDIPWLTRGDVTNRFARAEVTHNKLGKGPLNAGGEVFSEATILKGVGKKTYAIAWSNLQSTDNFSFDDIVAVIRDTIREYEK